MSIQNNQLSQEVKALCKDCNSFYSSEAFNGYCSSCFKKNQSVVKTQCNQSKETNVLPPDQKVDQPKEDESLNLKRNAPVKRQQLDKKRCFQCNKKVGLLGVQCKCTFVFCNGHRLPEDHECEYNHKEKGQKKLETQMVKIQFQKIEGI